MLIQLLLWLLIRLLLKAYELAALTSMAGATSMSAMCTSTMVKQRLSDAT